MTEGEMMFACSDLAWATGVVDAFAHTTESKDAAEVLDMCVAKMGDVLAMLHEELALHQRVRMAEKVMGSDRTQADQ